jgi:hypothetical protein
MQPWSLVNINIDVMASTHSHHASMVLAQPGHLSRRA